MIASKPYLYLHPGTCFGKPTINGSRLYVQAVAGNWWGGMTEQEIYDTFPSCIGKPELLLACWWMARYGTRTWRKRWGQWLREVAGELWRLNYKVPLPPQTAGTKA